MSGPAHHVDLSSSHLRLDGAAGTISRIGFGVGVLGLLATGGLMFTGGAETWVRGLQSYLLAFCYFLSLSLGALFFVLINHLTRAGWSVVVRRFAEGFAANFVLLAALALPLLLPDVRQALFEWARPEAVAHDHLLQAKSPYLNSTFFLVRMGLYFLIWIGLSEWFFARSVAQDSSGDPGLTMRMQQVSAPGMYLFALSLTFASFDLLMSLEAHWFSTIFGVYFFAGSVLAFCSLLPVVSLLLQRSGRLTSVISLEHYHDMGKLIFAFLVFWAYIAFSQYMLIWYANIPEETIWYLKRQTGQWAALSWFLLIGHFLVPFLALISRIPKRRKAALATGAVWMLIVHYADLFYLAMPHTSEGRVPFHVLDLTAFVAFAGLYVGAFARRMRNRTLVPERDPRLAESLAFENF